MKATIKSLFTVFLLLSLSNFAYADGHKWEIDPAHSGIYFSVNHIYSQTRGYFEAFDGTVVFSPKDLSGSRFDFEVDVKSINTGNTKRDGHLNSADFFDSKKYPKMAFTSTGIRHVKGNRYEVEGKITVKDVTQSITVPFVLLGVRNHPMDKKKEVAGLEAKMMIDRLAYHVGGGKFYDMGVVGKDVGVVISLEVTRKK